MKVIYTARLIRGQERKDDQWESSVTIATWMGEELLRPDDHQPWRCSFFCRCLRNLSNSTSLVTETPELQCSSIRRSDATFNWSFLFCLSLKRGYSTVIHSLCALGAGDIKRNSIWIATFLFCYEECAFLQLNTLKMIDDIWIVGNVIQIVW